MTKYVIDTLTAYSKAENQTYVYKAESFPIKKPVLPKLNIRSADDQQIILYQPRNNCCT